MHSLSTAFCLAMLAVVAVTAAPAPQEYQDPEAPSNEYVISQAKSSGQLPLNAIVHSILPASNQGSHVYSDGLDVPLDLYNSLARSLPSDEFNSGDFKVNFIRYSRK